MKKINIFLVIIIISIVLLINLAFRFKYRSKSILLDIIYNNIEKFIDDTKNTGSKFNVFFFKETKRDYIELDKKTWFYQKKFGFEVNPRKGHEFWNVEADAFKHAFGSANMYFKYGENISAGACIVNEWQINNNPQREWNMDAWNDSQGYEIAKEILKEYGAKYKRMPEEKRDDIVAVKVMERMQSGQLIIHPEDKRNFDGFWENSVQRVKLWVEGRKKEQE